MAPRWLPLESNPEVMNKFLQTLGVDRKWQFFDVFGVDPDLLAIVPAPCRALLLLFPINEKFKPDLKHTVLLVGLIYDGYENFRKEEDEIIKKNGQEVSQDVYFTKQTVGNACGTVGIIHSIANNLNHISLGEGFLKKFLSLTKSMSPEERAKALEDDEGISSAHEESAKEGQTETPSLDTKVDLHFIAFVHKDGSLYELDGRKNFPINHGKTSEETFLQDAALACQKFMERDSSSVHFNIAALCKSD